MRIRMFLTFLCLHAPVISAYRPVKFKDYYYSARATMEEAAEECRPELEAYWTNTRLNAKRSPCGLAQNCLLTNLMEYSKANYATAAILLGLSPTMLGFVGPVVQDTAMLMMRRPFLASLIVIGAPSASPVPLLSHAVDTTMTPSAVMLAVGRYFSRDRSGDPPTRSAKIILSAVQYLLASGAVANTLHVAIELDYKSVLVWACSAFGVPIGWVLTAVLMHWVSALGFRFRVKVDKTKRDSHLMSDQRSKLIQLKSKLEQLLASEFLPTFFQPLPGWMGDIGPTTIASNLLSWLSSMIVLLHYVVGTMIFSSFLFVGTIEAGYILGRLVGSALICRMLLWLEHDSLSMQVQRKYGADSIVNLGSRRQSQDVNEQEIPLVTITDAGERLKPPREGVYSQISDGP